MTHSTQVSGPGRPMNERRDAAKEQEGLSEVLDGATELQQADTVPGQQVAGEDADADRQATGRTAG